MTSLSSNPTIIELSNLLYLGSYSSCISKSNKLQQSSSDNDASAEQLLLAYRIYEWRANIALGQYDYVLDEIKEEINKLAGNQQDQIALDGFGDSSAADAGKSSSYATDTSLKAVQLLASYCKAKSEADSSTVNDLLEQLEKYLDDPSRSANQTLLVIASIVYNREANYIAALKAVHAATNLEMFHLMISTYLRIQRVDLAQDALKRMQEMNDDATLTHLTLAMVSLCIGGPEKVQEAQYLYQELNQKYNDAIVVLNGLALTNMTRGEFEEAEQHLQAALNKKSNDVDSLVNMIVCQTHLKSDRQVKRYMTQLKSVDPEHPWLQDRKKKADEFDSQMGSYEGAGVTA